MNGKFEVMSHKDFMACVSGNIDMFTRMGTDNGATLYWEPVIIKNHNKVFNCCDVSINGMMFHVDSREFEDMRDFGIIFYADQEVK